MTNLSGQVVNVLKGDEFPSVIEELIEAGLRLKFVCDTHSTGGNDLKDPLIEIPVQADVEADKRVPVNGLAFLWGAHHCLEWKTPPNEIVNDTHSVTVLLANLSNEG